MIQQIDASNIGAALDLLGRGWANRTRQFWETALERLRLAGGNAATGVSIGHILMVDKNAVGVLLTPATLRIGPEGERQHLINLSSWYIDPPHRWRAPLMLRSVLRDPSAVFTDLSPTEQVQRMLPALGFSALNDGEGIVVLPYAAMTRCGTGSVEDLSVVPEGLIAPTTRELLEVHRAFGCIAAGMIEKDTWYPLLFKHRTIRGLPAAQLVYCENNSALYRNLGPVARHLARRGRLLLSIDIPPGGTIAGIERRHRGKKFARGGLFRNRTDYAGSELSLFDL